MVCVCMCIRVHVCVFVCACTCMCVCVAMCDVCVHVRAKFLSNCTLVKRLIKQNIVMLLMYLANSNSILKFCQGHVANDGQL